MQTETSREEGERKEREGKWDKKRKTRTENGVL